MSQDEILTISDVASYLKVTEKTLYGLAQKGDLPGFKFGGQWRFRRAAIDSWIDVKTNITGGRPVDTEASWDNPDSKTELSIDGE